MAGNLRDRIRANELLIGTFLKTPAPHTIEILGWAGLDFIVIDQEHAPLGMAEVDIMSMAARSVGLPIVTRRWGAQRDWIAPHLDLGLDGVMVPHVMDQQDAEAVCDAVKFGRGKRGISASPRAGNYGVMGLEEYRNTCDANSVVMVQIEDESALDHLDAIAAIEDVDMLFIGPADLSQSLGAGLPSAELDEAIMKVIEAGRRNNTAVGLFVGDVAQIEKWHAKGITLFVCASDQSMLRKAAQEMMSVGKASA